MILNPTPGKKYQVWYRKEAAGLPLHGKVVECVKASRPKKEQGPRNHLVSWDYRFWVVPCGNLRVAP